MAQRKLLYGYQIQNGEYTVIPEESATVKRIFEMYVDGASYAEIAMTLQKECVPYNEDSSQWDKHKVKRILENRKYTGAENYPQVISTAMFQKAQDIIAAKANNRGTRDTAPKELLWRYVRCGDCEARAARSGRPRYGNIYFKCSQCGKTVHFKESQLIETIMAQINDSIQKNSEYAQSSELVRIENAINRQLESGEASDGILPLILKGISARYACYCGQEEQPALMELSQLDPAYFKQHISAITLSEDSKVIVTFR